MAAAVTGEPNAAQLMEQRAQLSIQRAWQIGAIQPETRIPLKDEICNRAIGLIRGQRLAASTGQAAGGADYAGNAERPAERGSGDGSAFPAKKLIPRLTVCAVRSETAWAAPADWGTRSSNWERRRKITWDYADELTDADIQIDGGFASDAAIQIRTSDGPLTVAAVIPVVTIGG